jgi:hypothetical protein
VNYLSQVDIGNEFKSPIGTTLSIGTLLSNFVSLGIVIAGIIILVMFILGGYSLIAGAGSNNPDQAEKGKKMITSAVIGFVVVFAAFWIVRLLEVITGTTFLTNPKF